MRRIKTHELEGVWPQVYRWIEKAVEYGQGDEDALDVAVALYNGRYDLWLGDEFAAVTQTVKYAKQRVLTILYIGGKLDNILSLFDWAKAWCKEHDIDVLRTYGRPGWERVTGLKRVGVILQESL